MASDPTISNKRLRKLEIERDVTALRLAGSSVRQISEKLSLRPTTVEKTLSRVAAKAQKEIDGNASALRAQQVQRIDRMMASIWHDAVGEEVKDGKVIGKKPPDLKKHDRIVVLMKRKAALLGLDVPRDDQPAAAAASSNVVIYVPDNGRGGNGS